MAQSKTVKIPFPMKGLNRRWALANQPPNTTPHAENVRPDATFEERTRGGSRPGMVRAYVTPNTVGDDSTERVTMLGQVRAINPFTGSTIRDFWEDDFSAPGNDIIQLPSPWLFLEAQKLWWDKGEEHVFTQAYDAFTESSAIASSYFYSGTISQFSAVEPYTLTLVCKPFPITNDYFAALLASLGLTATIVGGVYRLIFRMHDTVPGLLQDSISLEVNFFNSQNPATDVIQVGDFGKTAITYRQFVGGSEIKVFSTPGITVDLNQPVRMSAIIDGNDLQFFVNSSSALSLTMPNAAGSSFGFGINAQFKAITDSRVLDGAVDNIQLEFGFPTPGAVPLEANRAFLVAASGNNFYAETSPGATTLDLVSDGDASEPFLWDGDIIQSAQRGGQLYIADHEGGVTAATGTATISGASNNVLTDATATFQTDGIDSDNYVLVLTAADTPSMVNDQYEFLVANETTLALLSGAGANGLGVYTIVRAPKVYDPITQTLSLWSASAANNFDVDGTGILTNLSQVPLRCPLIAAWRDRIVLAGGSDAPQQFYMSRSGDADDWDYSQFVNDTGDIESAISGTQTDAAGVVGEPITAIAAHSDDYLVIWTLSGTFIVRGELTLNGQIDAASREVGCVAKSAWTRTPRGEMVWLSRNGIYMIPPGAAQFPISLSEEALPTELEGIDENIWLVNMEYDVKENGIHLYISARDSTLSNHYWFDWEQKSFWPYVFNSSVDPTATIHYEADSSTNATVIVGAKDSRLRRFEDSAPLDDGLGFDRNIVFGPFRVGEDDRSVGMIRELIFTMANDSDATEWELYVGDSGEDALDAALNGAVSPFASGTLDSGFNARFRPRARAYAACLVVKSVGPIERWALERIDLVLKTAGEHRIVN